MHGSAPGNYFSVVGEGGRSGFFSKSGHGMRIVGDENIPFVKEAFSTFGEVTTLPGRTISRSDLIDAEMLLVRSVTRVDEALLGGTPVQFVASATIGIDHIDREYLEKNNIGFTYAPGSNADSVAEYFVAALAVMTKRKKRAPADLSLGIIGVGNTGSRVFKHALTLGMRTLLCDPPKQRQTHCDMYRSLDEVLAGADVVSLHVPLVATGPERTMRMVDASFIGRMNQGALLINTSRGKVVDEPALLDRRDHLGGLVLDVWDNEPAIRTELVEAADLATPHIAGYSFDGKVRGTRMIYEAACAWYFRKPQWSPAGSIDEPEAEIEVKESVDHLRNTILQAYPIEDDDRRLRQIVSLGKEEQSHYFDELRKNYPRRREFPHFAVKSRGYPVEVIGQLKQLGFRVGRGMTGRQGDRATR